MMEMGEGKSDMVEVGFFRELEAIGRNGVSRHVRRDVLGLCADDIWTACSKAGNIRNACLMHFSVCSAGRLVAYQSLKCSH